MERVHRCLICDLGGTVMVPTPISSITSLGTHAKISEKQYIDRPVHGLAFGDCAIDLSSSADRNDHYRQLLEGHRIFDHSGIPA